jgi:chromosome segregation ATPase
MAAQYKADIDKMSVQHKEEMQTLVQSELQKLEEKHAREMGEALAARKRMQQRAEDVKLVLGKRKLTADESIDMVLKSFEGSQDPSLIEQLRKDIKAREAELNDQITQSNQQLTALQSRLDSSRGTEQKLNDEIKTLTQYRENAEKQLQSVKQGTAERSKEVQALNNCIESMTKEINELKSQLDRLASERDAGQKEIWELREWKKNAEVEREQLEKDLKSKDGVIAKLQYDFDERDEDVNVLVPEVRVFYLGGGSVYFSVCAQTTYHTFCYQNIRLLASKS